MPLGVLKAFALGRTIHAAEVTPQEWASSAQLPTGALRDGLARMNVHYDHYGHPAATPSCCVVARAGETVNVPANAPHGFRNTPGQPARLLCLCSPAGQEEFFMAVGVRVSSRTEPLPAFDAAAQAAFTQKAEELSPQYRTELLAP